MRELLKVVHQEYRRIYESCWWAPPSRPGACMSELWIASGVTRAGSVGLTLVDFLPIMQACFKLFGV